jgi:hypothetical protein
LLKRWCRQNEFEEIESDEWMNGECETEIMAGL